MGPSDSPSPLHFRLPWRALRHTDAQAPPSINESRMSSIQHRCFLQLRVRSTDVVPPSTQGSYGAQFTGELDHVEVARWSGRDP